jgi:hypothetical protein
MSRHAFVPWSVLVLAAVVRIFVAIVGLGTNDTFFWHQFGREVVTWPLGDVWRYDRFMNNPPLPAMYTGMVYAAVGERVYEFSLLFKLPSIIAEVVAIGLIARITLDRTDSPRAARLAALAYALNPGAILISSYHGNIDAVLAMLSLVAWYLASRGRFGWAGLAAGAAINCKVSAAPAALLLLWCARSRREFVHALAALSFMVIPYAIAFGVVGRIFLERVLLYRPPVAMWLLTVPDELRNWNFAAPLMAWLSLVHSTTLIQVTLLTTLLLAVWWHLRGYRRVDLLTLGALYWTWFVLWIGGAYQYAIWPLPLLAATRPRIALGYGVGLGVWLAWSYGDVLMGTWPLQSVFLNSMPTRSRFALPLPLIMLVVAIVSLTRRDRVRETTASAETDGASQGTMNCALRGEPIAP